MSNKKSTFSKLSLLQNLIGSPLFSGQLEMTALFLYTKEMSDRFWKAYYYIMWFCFVFGLYIVFDADDNSIDFFSSGDEWLGWTVTASAIPMTIIRYILIGKHFWQKP